jgi:hypothetical protein
MPHSDRGPNRSAEVEKWEGRLDELFARALAGERRWTNKDGVENSSYQADVKGALDVIRFALQLHGRIAPEQKAAHAESCGCSRCTRFRTAENEVTAKVRELRSEEAA